MNTLPYANWLALRGTDILRELQKKYRFIWSPKHPTYYELIPRENEKEQDK